MIVRVVLTILLAVIPVSAAAQDIGSDAQREAGKLVYGRYCEQCHGVNGDGQGIAKPYFWPTPRDFTYGLYKIRTTPSGALPTHDDLKRVIRNGMPYTGMPAWPNLSDEELNNVVYYIKTFNEGFADADVMEPPITIPDAPGSSEESLQRGREIYEANKCTDCHGELGRGDGKSAPTLKNDWGEPIKPADLTRRWTFRGGSTKADIYRTFTTGLNGTPMPSYADLISEEDRWHLVNYVFSLSRDEPDYATVLIAEPAEGGIDIGMGESLFDGAHMALFPVFGQVIQPGRDFFPSSNAIEVKAVYSADEVAIMLTWSDMTGETSGTNGPTMAVPMFDPAAPHVDDKSGLYSDAVAVQFPAESRPGFVKPYMLFGDTKNAMNIWFADLATSTAQLFIGRGSESIEETGDEVPIVASYADGRWSVIFKRSRHPEGGYAFDEGVFIPISFSVWDGYRGERGNKRGLTSWYHLYLRPMETESKLPKIAGYGVLTLVLELVVIGVVRKRNGLYQSKQQS